MASLSNTKLNLFGFSFTQTCWLVLKLRTIVFIYGEVLTTDVDVLSLLPFASVCASSLGWGDFGLKTECGESASEQLQLPSKGADTVKGYPLTGCSIRQQ